MDAREHAVALCAAFDTASAFALSFGIKKFQFMQKWVKLVGEIVGEGGRKPNWNGMVARATGQEKSIKLGR